MDQIYTPKQDYKVLCYCITFNQSKYIEDTLNGFAMQKTTFPFACLVVEDCSTDGEQDVIKAWLERECDMSKAEHIDLELSNVILVPHKTNENCTFAIYLLKRNLWREPKLKETLVKPWREHCEYEAICEGDDYWIADDKLQKQVDILDNDKGLSFCHTGFYFFHQTSGAIISADDIIESNLTLHNQDANLIENVLDSNQYRVQLATVLVRMSKLDKANEILSTIPGQYLMGDTQLCVVLLSLGPVYYIPDKTTIYRVIEGSASRQTDIRLKTHFNLSTAEMRVVMSELFVVKDELKKKFQKQYQKQLNLYLCYEPGYKRFVEIKFATTKDRLQFYILNMPFIRPILRYIYTKRKKHN